MPLYQLIASFGTSGSDAITNGLGVIAIVAFVSTVTYIVVVQLRESARKQAAARLRRQMGDGAERKEKSLMEFDDGYNAELQRLRSNLDGFYQTTIENASRKCEELVRLAKSTFGKIADAYGNYSVGFEGETKANRVSRFESVCERQWGFFRSEMTFLSYTEVSDNLRHILETARLLEAHVTRKTDESMEVSSEMLRSQEIISLARAMAKDGVGELQAEMLHATVPFRDYYDRHVKEWFNDRLFRIVAKMKERGEKGVTIGETDMKDRFTNLKSRMEMVARLCDRLAQNTQKIGEDSIAFSQIVYVGTVLRIIGEMGEWFPEAAARGASESEAEPAESAR